jgi:hypothetical protein
MIIMMMHDQWTDGREGRSWATVVLAGEAPARALNEMPSSAATTLPSPRGEAVAAATAALVDEGAAATPWSAAARLALAPPSPRRRRQQFGDDELIVNYRDAVVYGRDLKLLESPSSWLNDSLVHFGMLRLLHGSCRTPTDSDNNSGSNGGAKRARRWIDDSSTLASSSPGGVLCVDPSVLSFLMHQVLGGEDEDEELQDFCLSHNCFRGIQVVFLPVNDDFADPHWAARAHTGTAAGTHWSLLVAVASAADRDGEENVRGPLQFHHFDSVRGHNRATAVAVATLWSRVWQMAQESAPVGEAVAKKEAAPPTTAAAPAAEAPAPGSLASLNSTTVRVRECAGPQQSNGYDCGLHVLGSVEAILLLLLSERDRCPRKPMTAAAAAAAGIDEGTAEAAVAEYFGFDQAEACTRLRQRMAREIRDLATA